MFHVRPEADRAGEILPHTLIFPHGLLALVDKRLQSVCLDLILAVQTELFLYLNLHRQTVRVPAGNIGRLKAAPFIQWYRGIISLMTRVST